MKKKVSKQVIAAVMEVVFFVVFVICFRTICIHMQNASGDYNLIEALLQTRTAFVAAIASVMVLKILHDNKRTDSDQLV